MYDLTQVKDMKQPIIGKTTWDTSSPEKPYFQVFTDKDELFIAGYAQLLDESFDDEDEDALGNPITVKTRVTKWVFYQKPEEILVSFRAGDRWYPSNESDLETCLDGILTEFIYVLLDCNGYDMPKAGMGWTKVKDAVPITRENMTKVDSLFSDVKVNNE